MRSPFWLARLALWLAVLPAPTLAALPSFEAARAAYRPSDAWLLDRHGEPVAVLRIDAKARRLPWAPLPEIAPALQKAVLLSEDKRFLEHAGVDWQAAAAGAWNNLWQEKTRGASTLSMQLVGLLDAERQRQGRRGWFEKLDQAVAALRLERHWSKPQILEAYLNLAPFRGELVGIAALSRGLFDKAPDGLDEAESALAAALLRAPNAAPAVVARRACVLLQEARREAFCRDLDLLAEMRLGRVLQRADTTPVLAPHLARRLLSQPGQRRTSTLDAATQRFAAETLRRQLGALTRHNVADGAVVVIDNASGAVLAWVGSSGPLSEAPAVDGVMAPRQAGSTLKPFLYGLAFERRHLTPASLIEDAPLALPTGNGLYAPQNYEPDYRGRVSARAALGGSLNVPAVKTLLRIGADDFAERLRRFGFDSLVERGDWYGHSLALGSADVTLLALANAFRTLANGGQWTPLRLATDLVLPGVSHRALSPQAAFLVADILADRGARAGTFGLESWLATPYWSAAKTGTSKDMRDNWCIGFSRRFTVAVWVGNASGAAMHEVSGITGAAPVWREIMDWLPRGETDGRPLAAPAGVVKRDIRFEPPVEPPRTEWFLAGTELERVRGASAEALARISYPTNGAVIALDPDIPPGRQRIALQLSAVAAPGWRWRIHDQWLGRADQPQSWLPQPGRHQLALVDARGGEIESVSFEVRSLPQPRHP
jgi:penicillin-binding protein 1C